jgi:hypothetical protein
MNQLKDFLFAVFVAFYTGFLFAVAIGSGMVVLKLFLFMVGQHD